MSTLRELLDEARTLLAAQPAAALEAEVLLAHLLDKPRSFLYAHGELELADREREAFRRLLRRRQGGEPIAYITGQREFWSLPLTVTPGVLIPRAETELLVEQALQLIPEKAAWRLADLGTGSGAIALALASERPSCEVHAVDVSAAALAVARGNARALGLQRIRFHQGDWCAPLTGHFHLIACNPPYVAADDECLQRGDCRFEPRRALSPAGDALDCIRLVVEQARDRQCAGGWLLLEHGPDQGAPVRGLLRGAGYGIVKTRRDLLGHERLSMGRRPA